MDRTDRAGQVTGDANEPQARTQGSFGVRQM
jgi:hypothetical protein